MDTVVEFVVMAHKGQVRKHSGLPYVVHPFQVLTCLSEWGVNCPICWKAALCHDVLEDCPQITFEMLSDVIGQEAANIVQELTFVGPKSEKAAYMASFATKSVQALVIKIADRWCNTNDFELHQPDYALKYWDKAEKLFDEFVNRQQEIVDCFGMQFFEKVNLWLY